MRILIEIPEYVIDDMKECGFIPEEDNEELCKAIDNGTPIPDNATNGDVIRALFEPNWIRRMDDVVREEYEFDAVWWNAPYKAESEKQTE